MMSCELYCVPKASRVTSNDATLICVPSVTEIGIALNLMKM